MSSVLIDLRCPYCNRPVPGKAHDSEVIIRETTHAYSPLVKCAKCKYGVRLTRLPESEQIGETPEYYYASQGG